MNVQAPAVPAAAPQPAIAVAPRGVIAFAPIAALAGKELRDRLRNRWVIAVALVFTAFSLLITYFGGATQGVVGPRSVALTIASLVSLVIYLVPLIALLLGFDAVVGERERGSLDLLLALPITRLELLLGKYLGLAAALTLSTVGGFALVAVLLWQRFGAAGLAHYAGFVGSAVLLGLSFLSLALALSVVARDRARASGLAIVLWFGLVLVFDLALLGVLVATGGSWGGDLLAWALLANPADIFRILNLYALDGLQAGFGLAALVPAAFSSPLAMVGALCAWIVVPLAAACWRFKP